MFFCRRLLSWRAPTGQPTGVHVFNSLTRSLVPLVLPKPGELTWYQCGPTVYDHAHIGHACTYVRFDIVRRILSQHCGLRVRLVMGMTDVDDKIIQRARQLGETPTALARRFEREFAAQMQLLRVLPPLAVTRVSEHIPEIVAMISRIMDRGHAYAAPDGSVYFDTGAFGSRYGKLHPSRQVGPADAAAHDAAPAGMKRRAADFALWKAEKAGEIAWPSPWGPGRPGWHIECSAMSSVFFGSQLDLHSGGIDLCFPHHENEIAQSESAHGVEQWANYFLHAGHVLLADVKISKSLGNTISITDVLAKYTPSQFRIFCLLLRYNQSVNYSSELMAAAVAVEARFVAFLQATARLETVGVRLSPAASLHWGPREFALDGQLSEAKVAVDLALRGNFDTPAALQSLQLLVTATNTYVHGFSGPNPQLVGAVSAFVAQTLHMLGVDMINPDAAAMHGWAAAAPHRLASSDTGETTNLAPVVNTLVHFRSQVRQLAIEAQKSAQGTHSLAAAVLRECDAARAQLAAGTPSVAVQDARAGGSSWHLR